jgi:adenylosuccinate synthase
MKIDIVLGLQYGDEGKGKVCHSLLKDGLYTHVIRFNGGGNAGHTIYHDGKKLVTHLIPSGVFFGVKSIIGPGCVVDVEKLFREIDYLEDNGIKTEGLLFISKNAHIITDDQLTEDATDTAIGTTRTGNGPCYRDKYNRKGVRAEEIPMLEPYLIDMYEEFYETDNSNFKILAEGAQAFGLDIDWGDYPYVTSSHCGVGSVLNNGFNHKHINKVYGIIKAYETYVGAKKFQPEEEIFEKIQQEGQEFGATTGRKRQCNWIDWNLVMKAARMNGINRIVMNKVDILNKVQAWKIKHNGEILEFTSESDFVFWVKKEFSKEDIRTSFSYTPHDFDVGD